MDKEEGEMSDDNMDVDNSKDITIDEKSCTLFEVNKDGLTVKKLEKVDAKKLEERARRFGLNLTGNRVVTQKQIDELYASSGIEEDNERHFRLDTVHLKGVEGLTTKDIFEYLEDYKPVSLEWVDDTSCNVVCQDHIAAALALLVHSRPIKNEVLNEMINNSSQYWREGMPHPKKDFIIMRFGTNGDKKIIKKKSDKKVFDENVTDLDLSCKNPWGDLCKSWGVHDHQEIFNRRLPVNEEEFDITAIKNKRLAMRLGKRKKKQNVSESESGSENEWKKKSKTPRLRMHADDEESRQKKQVSRKQQLEYSANDIEEYAPLSIEVINSQNSFLPRPQTKLSEKFKNRGNSNLIKEGLQSRLGVKVITSADNYLSSDEFSSDESDYNVMSRVQKVNNEQKTVSSVWERLETTKPRKSNSQNDLRQKIKSKNQTNSDDLRGRISKAKQSNLLIQIDNS